MEARPLRETTDPTTGARVAPLLSDGRLGTPEEIRWLSDVFGGEAADILAEGRRILRLCDRIGATTPRVQECVLQSEWRLRSSRTLEEVDEWVAQHPDPRNDRYWTCRQMFIDGSIGLG
jgi:hypothetical protein